MSTDRSIISDKTRLRGATITDDGVYFSIYSENATALNVHLYDDNGSETNIIALSPPSETERAAGNHLWTTMQPGLTAGQRYHLSADGPWVPEQGLRFNPNKRLADPDAKAFDGSFSGDAILKEENFGYHWNSPWKDLAPNNDSNAQTLPYCVVAAPLSQAGRPARPKIAKEQLIIVEAHVDDTTHGLSASDLPEGVAPGSIRAMASTPVLDVLNRTKRNAVQLLPVNEFPEEGTLKDRGLTQHWGYNTVAFQAMTDRYGSPADYAAAIDGLHAAGKAVILDVVFNHTAEGDEQGPTFSFKGLDNTTYYDLCPENKRFYDKSHTGVGNRLNTNHPETQDFVVRSLVHMRCEYKIDGFRFDLLPALFLDEHKNFDPNHVLFAKINAAMNAIDREEAEVEAVKNGTTVEEEFVPTVLIAESWDVKTNAYGRLPEGWMQQSNTIRDELRDAAQGKLSAAEQHELLYGMKPHDTVAFVTAHDGFTLNDLVSFKDKHNHANGDDGTDGHDDNHSCNGGVEGPTDQPVVNSYRDRVQERVVGLLHAGQYAIMTTMSDIFRRHTQFGNNNSYCRKNPIDWSQRDLAWEDGLGRDAELHQKIMTADHIEPLDTDGQPVIPSLLPEWKQAHEEKIVQPNGETMVVCVNSSHSDVPFHLPGNIDWKQIAGTEGDRFSIAAFSQAATAVPAAPVHTTLPPAIYHAAVAVPVDPRPFA